MPIYSHSSLSTFENCPQKFQFQYILKPEVEEKESIYTFFGSLVHHAIQKIYKDLNNGKVNTLDETLQFFRSEWEKNWNDSIEIYEPNLTKDNYISLGEKCIGDYYSRNKPFADGKTIGIEYPVLVDLNNDKKYRLRGYIDRLVKVRDGVYEIHDYKTNKDLPTQADKDTDRQLAIYQLGIKDQWTDVDDVTLVWHFVRFDTAIKSKRTPQQLKELQTTLIQLIDEIEKATEEKNFPPVKSGLCNFCEYQHLCPLWKHPLSMEQLPVNKFLKDGGVKLVNQYAELVNKKKAFNANIKDIELEMEQIKEALFHFAEKNKISLIVGSGNEVELYKAITKQIPKKGEDPDLRKQLDDFLKELPVWKDISDLATGKLEDLLEEQKLDEKLEKKINKFLVEKEIETFKFRKKKEEED